MRSEAARPGPRGGAAGHRLAALDAAAPKPHHPVVRRLPAAAERSRRAGRPLHPASAAAAPAAARPHRALGGRCRRRHGDPAGARRRAHRPVPEEPGAAGLRRRPADPPPPGPARLSARLSHYRGDQRPGLHRLHRPAAAVQHPADQCPDPGQQETRGVQRPRHRHGGSGNAVVRPGDRTAQRLPHQPDFDGDLPRHAQRREGARRHHQARRR